MLVQYGIGNYVTINPSKGSLFYIGLVGQRPTGWLGELLALIAKDNKPVSSSDEWDWGLGLEVLSLM